MNKRELKITGGFMLEVICFTFGGLFVGLGHFMSGVLILALGFLIAFLVGQEIAINAINKLKGGKDGMETVKTK